MKHAYLSEKIVNDALTNNAITEQEAQRLMLKITSQVKIFKATHK